LFNALKNFNLIEVSNYLDNIKKDAYKDIIHIQNNVLNKNPYTSDFISNYLNKKQIKKQSLFYLLKQIFLFYIKNFVHFGSYIICYIFFKLFGKKCAMNLNKDIYLIDIFFQANKIIENSTFEDISFFPGLYEALKKSGKTFAFIPRVVDTEKNPLKFLKFIRILSRDNKYNYLFEFELVTLYDLLKILGFILIYPIRQFELLQKENSEIDKNFNYELFQSLPNTSFEGYKRYLVGKRISKRFTKNVIIISWQEFQNLEKSFNRAIKESSNKIFIYGCEFLIKYENYLSMHITDTDVDLKITPHLTLLNGLNNFSNSHKHNFKIGVALRYKNIFRDITNINESESYLALLSYGVKDSQYLLNTVSSIKNLSIKLHPTTNSSQFNLHHASKWKYTSDNLNNLFEKTSIVFVASMTGTALEAIASGVSVIIINNPEKLLVHPLIEHGRSKMWDIVNDDNELITKMNILMKYRKENINEIMMISKWYKDNFFIEPNEKNIIKAFDLC